MDSSRGLLNYINERKTPLRIEIPSYNPNMYLSSKFELVGSRSLLKNTNEMETPLRVEIP